ncbi:TetR/AcrR family transcriptional regulator [Pseudonocardia sp. N23]|uniref:TetR/AcrR family transcriptional regulator n=1 Tax=Pseudonocardia sp. N23 TaxID=1987376 RepID=UPI000BFC01FF|nr:TetR/AcrR family transcriptional regulator [Pseudonocardia sp. N23]GAY11187.1 transcriptional regulator, tetr family [Pseudonocardia sp. N23]
MPRPPGHGSGFEPRRREIIDTAAELFARRGYAATGITEICEAVGLARGALYYYIGSKEQLLVEIQSAVLVPLLAAAREIAELRVRPVVRLRLLSELLLEQIVLQLDHIWVYEHDYRQLSVENQATLVAQRHSFEDVVAELLAAAVEAGEFREMDVRLGMLQFLNMHNHTYQWVRPSGRWNAAHLSEQYCATLFRGFAAAGFDPSTIEAETARYRAANDDLPTLRAVTAAPA